MSEGLLFERVAPDAVFVVDSRQFESALYIYDDRIANSLMLYGAKPEQDVEESAESDGVDIPS